MTAFPSDLNTQSIAIKPYMLVDQVSATEIYIGTSLSFNAPGAAVWRINKIVQNGSVWVITAYPDGDQGFNYIWNDRFGYTYS